MMTATYIHQDVRPKPGRAAMRMAWKEVERALGKVGGTVDSVSGLTAALAVNFCEARGYDYTLQRHDGRYVLTRRVTRHEKI